MEKTKANNDVNKIEIFESSLCCPTGLCGPEPDKSLVELQNTIQVLLKANIEVKRYAINQVPMEFINNLVVKEFIMTKGVDKLPLTLFNEKIIKESKYPTLVELNEIIPEINNIKLDSKIIGMF